MTDEPCKACGHVHAGAAFASICIGCPCAEIPAEPQSDSLWKCCRCCDGNSACAALPDRHRAACNNTDSRGDWTCDAQEATA